MRDASSTLYTSLNFCDKDLPVPVTAVGLPFRAGRHAFIFPSIQNGDRFKRNFPVIVKVRWPACRPPVLCVLHLTFHRCTAKRHGKRCHRFHRTATVSQYKTFVRIDMRSILCMQYVDLCIFFLEFVHFPWISLKIQFRFNNVSWRRTDNGKDCICAMLSQCLNFHLSISSLDVFIYCKTRTTVLLPMQIL